MKLNLGCGDDVRPGMVNVDVRPVGQVVADAAALPFRDACAQVYAQDLLEHFPAHQTGAVLDEWRRVCTGRITVRVPNLHALSAAIVAKPHAPHMLIRNVYGGHRYGPDGSLDAHHHGWTPITLHRDLADHGFTVESNDQQLNMTVEAAPHG